MIPIAIENLTKRFGGVVALEQVNLRIEPGEIFFLLGPSGCGKTTLLRTLAGFHIPDEGRVLFGGEDVTRLPPHRRNTGMMFQSYALWPHMSVAENVAFGLEERKVPRKETTRRVGEALASVRMEAYADRRINQLSGGQQQRVALARAMVVRPRCLFLDEPLSNLDAKLRLEMRGEIRRICREHQLTAIYVTHDQKEALSIADRLAILDNGHVRQVGPPAEVYRRPNTKFVADFIGETNFISGEIEGVTDGFTVVNTALGRLAGVLAGSQAAQGDKVTLSVRPECWVLGGNGGNTVRGRLEDTVYLGETAQHRFVASGCALKIFELNPRLADASTDLRSTVSVSPEDVVILRE